MTEFHVWCGSCSDYLATELTDEVQAIFEVEQHAEEFKHWALVQESGGSWTTVGI